MKVAVFGYGSMGRRRAEILRSLGHEVGACDPTFSTAELNGLGEHDEFRCLSPASVFTDFKPDAAVVATPVAAHAEPTWLCVENGVPVLVEKPLAGSVRGVFGDELDASFAGACGLVRVGYQMRFMPSMPVLRSYVEQLKPAWARFITSSDLATWPGTSYADALLECSHEIDLALWLLGPATCVGASSRCDGGLWELLLEHDSGCLSSVHLDYVTGRYRRTWLVQGKSSLAAAGWDDAGDFRVRCGDREVGSEGESASIALAHAYREETESFLEEVRGQSSWRWRGCTVPEALQVLRIVDRARELAAAR